MTQILDLSNIPSTARYEEPAYASVDLKTDPRRRYAGSEWNRPGPPGYPVQTVSGEWMIPIIVNLPYGMIASLEAEAQSGQIDGLVRAALVAAGHGTTDDIAGVQSDRYLTIEECGKQEKRP